MTQYYGLKNSVKWVFSKWNEKKIVFHNCFSLLTFPSVVSYIHCSFNTVPITLQVINNCNVNVTLCTIECAGGASDIFSNYKIQCICNWSVDSANTSIHKCFECYCYILYKDFLNDTEIKKKYPHDFAIFFKKITEQKYKNMKKNLIFTTVVSFLWFIQMILFRFRLNVTAKRY